MPRKSLLILLFFILLSTVLVLPTLKTKAQAGTAYQMIAAINQLRANNGLGPLVEHPILMSIAQSHSEYQAARGQGGHYGPGGSTPKDRALAAGFGSEAPQGVYIAVSENWAAGNNLSIQRAVYEFWNDAAHMGTMLGSQYYFIGAGVAFDGDYVYYTVDTGGWPGAVDVTPNPNPPTGQAFTPQPTTTAIPVVTSTPNPDGAIIHTVRTGQTLYTISVVYDIPLEELMAINGFTENTVLYVGDEVTIQPGKTPTLAGDSPSPATVPPSPSPTGRDTPSPTEPHPTTTGSPPSPTPRPSATSPAPTENAPGTASNPTVIILAVVIAGGAIVATLIRGKD